jgi:hypothetical protein
MEQEIGFWRRVALSFVAFFAVLFNKQFATQVYQLRKEQRGELLPTPAALPSPGALPVPGALPTEEQPTRKTAHDRHDALQLLSMFQRDGRLIDFLQEDIAAFSDAEVGAAARAVHDGCSKALQSYFALEPVYCEPEGASIVVKDGFDPSAVRLTGNVMGSPPFRGSLKHHGWRAREVKMPSNPQGQDPAILAPAEVELP